ncbi:prepilin peptidase [Thermodesulfobacteriota bacterium B35]
MDPHHHPGISLDSLFLVASFVFGAVIGSFLNVVIYRLPDRSRSIVFPPSHCPHCSAPIRWYDNIPMLSYLLLRGRCRSCGEPISPRYPLVELCMALLSAALYARFGAGITFACYFPFLAALLTIIFIDIDHQIIPDVISLPGILLGFALSFVNPQVSWQQSALGILLGGGVLYGIAAGYMLLTRREGMGGGDIKLLAMIGGFLGWQSLLYVIFASSLAGSVVGIGAMRIQGKGGRTRIPFGPFLALAAMSYLFFREDIMALWQAYLATAGKG